MKAVKVQYKVQAEYIEQNKKNIQNVMEALRKNPIEGMMYSTYNLEEDGQTFVHINICDSGETLSKLNDVPEFQAFRMGLKESKPITPPAQSKLELVGSNFDV